MTLLAVRDLEVKFALGSGAVTALRNISFTLGKGERLGIVGESGAGKSVLGFSVLNLISKPGYIASGDVVFENENLAHLSAQELRSIRGNRISMIFQDPMMTLNPVLTIADQMIECLLAHRKMTRREARELALEKLKEVQIPSPSHRLDQYPHELSGGMKQRIVIAIALLLDPELIIADEPTTALDVTIQAEIMDLMLNLCIENNVALILITHDLGVVSEITQRLIVMYSGRIVEQGPTREIIDRPYHPYTEGLLGALPQMTQPGQNLRQIPGSMPTLSNLPSGCSFSPRCSRSFSRCKEQLPELRIVKDRQIACHLQDNTKGV